MSFFSATTTHLQHLLRRLRTRPPSPARMILVASALSIPRARQDVYTAGRGDLVIMPSVRFHCPWEGCEITVNITGNFCLGENATIITGTFELSAFNASFAKGTTVNTTGLGGAPPPQTSGTPQGIVGSGGSLGGRGAGCYTEHDKEEGKTPDDVWGGAAYSRQPLERPSSPLVRWEPRGTASRLLYGAGQGRGKNSR